MVQPLFYGKVFAPYRLILLPFSLRILIAFLPQTTVPNLALPGTSPPSEGLGEAPSPLSFIPLYHHRKRQLPYFFIVQPFRDPAIYTEKYALLQYFSHSTTRCNPTPPDTFSSSDGLGEAFTFLSFIPLYHHRKRQLPYFFIVQPFRDPAIYTEKYALLQYFSHSTTRCNPTPPDTFSSSDGLGEAFTFLSFIPLYHHRKRQLPYFFIVQPFRDQAIYTEKYEVLQYSSPANHDSQPYPARHIPSFGGAWGGRPFPFLFPLWAWESSLFIFQIFPSTPPLARKY